MLDKHYDFAAVEQRLYQEWETAGCFRAGVGAAPDAKPFTIVIPPPNVTGSLHMGHALNNTLQDILIRWHRMRGFATLWQPGTDHAGIATQMVVERQMLERQEPSRREIGREAFLEKVWAWKAESGGTISRQLRRLGASCDWSRERFTMDEGLSRAVLEVFVSLYKRGLIYKDKRLVNWDPKLETAISDLEVQQVEVKGHLWHFRYPIENGETYEAPLAFDDDGNPTEWETRDYIVVATTRPETMLGDTAVAVHPDDKRYQALIGKNVVLPIVGRKIPIVGDEYADPETGSGAVKITPAHDFNDFEVGVRNGLPRLNVLDRHACIVDGAQADAAAIPEDYRGRDRYDARKAVVAEFERLELLERIEDHINMTPHGDRSGVVIEPWLTDQWYVNAEELAKPAIKAVEDGETAFVPKNWERTYFEWMRNIQPWCISRQLWWGHQIPAWYGPDGQVFVELDEGTAKAAAKAHYGRDEPLARDEDVLDTWFSSALWPFSTLGWPDETPELQRYYKTDVLITGFDIIFFWVARMMMMGLHFMKDENGRPEVPFHTVYIHALVRDEKGQKMSKTKGNVIDPLDLIEDYGADSVRMTLTAMAAQGRDIKLAKSRVEGYRNFGTKLWNAVRFAQMNECARVADFDPAKVKQTLNTWIVGEVAATAREVDEALTAYRFNDAAGAMYRFTWNVFCDWYVEFSKPLLQSDDAAAKAETQATTAWVIDQILLLLHPVMPFVTEEIWALTGGHAAGAKTGRGGNPYLMLQPWPAYEFATDEAARAEMSWVIQLIEGVRSARAEMNVPAGAKIPLLLKDADAESAARLERHRELITRLARLQSVATSADDAAGAIRVVLDDAQVLLPISDIVDLSAEAERLGKELKKVEGEVAKLAGRLANPKYVERAPEAVVEEAREQLAEFESTATRLRDAIARAEAAA